MEYKGINGSFDQLQECSGFGSLSQRQGGWEIRNGKYEDAVKTLRIGIAMGNNVDKPIPHARRHVGRHRDSRNDAEHIMTIASQPDGTRSLRRTDANRAACRCAPIRFARGIILRIADRLAKLRRHRQSLARGVPSETRKRYATFSSR